MTSYHMLEYIHEIPAVLERTLAENEAPLLEVVRKAQEKQVRRVILTGVGSSYTAALMAAPLFHAHCPVPAYVFSSTELGPLLPALVDAQTLVVVVSRSGERGWVVDALKESIRLGGMGVAVTAMPDGLLAQNAQVVLQTREGPEIAFAKTKSVATCAGLLMRLALAFARAQDTGAAERLEALRAAPDRLRKVLEAVEPQVQALVPRIQAHKMVMAGGTISNAGAALEFAIKLQEDANVTVFALDTGNLLHGPWGPVGADWLVALLVTRYDLELSRKTLALAGKLKARRLAVVEPGLDLGGLAEYTIALPEPVDLLTAGLSYLIPLQLLTYYWSLANGLNPDAPAQMRTMLDAMLPPGREEPEMRGKN